MGDRRRSHCQWRLGLLSVLVLTFTSVPARGQAPRARKPGSPDSKHSVTTSRTSAEFDELSKQADAAREANQIPQAVELYQRAIRLKPRWNEGLWYLGGLYYDSDQYAKALAVFRSLVELSPDFGPAWAMLGLCEFETHDYKNSILHLQRSRNLGLRANEELVNVTRYHEALILNTLGQFESAKEILASLVKRGVRSENVKAALGMAELRVPLFPSQVDSSKDALIHAMGEVAALVAADDFDQAVQGFEQLLKDYPYTPFLHYAYGTALTTVARFDEAEKQFHEELRITSTSPFASMQLAALKLRTNRFDEALPLAQAAVQIAPQAFPAHYLLGRTWLELGNVPEAIKELELARRLGSYSPEVHYNLARAYAKGQRKADADRERKEFARLSGLEQGKLNQESAQSYRSSSDRAKLGPREVDARPASGPHD